MLEKAKRLVSEPSAGDDAPTEASSFEDCCLLEQGATGDRGVESVTETGGL